MTPKKRPGKKARKPQNLYIPGYGSVDMFFSVGDQLLGKPTFRITYNDSCTSLTIEKARRLASWLLKFADWAETRKK